VNIKRSFGLLSASSIILESARSQSTTILALLFRSQKSGFDFVLAETDVASEILLEAQGFAEVLSLVVASVELCPNKLVPLSVGCQLQIVNSFVWYVVAHLNINIKWAANNHSMSTYPRRSARAKNKLKLCPRIIEVERKEYFKR